MLLSNYRFNPFSETFSKDERKTEVNLTCIELTDIELENRKFFGLRLQDMPKNDKNLILLRKRDKKTMISRGNTFPKEPSIDEFIVDFKFNSSVIWLNSGNRGENFDVIYNTIESCNNVENENTHILSKLNPMKTALYNKINTEKVSLTNSINSLINGQVKKNKDEIGKLNSKWNKLNQLKYFKETQTLTIQTSKLSGRELDTSGNIIFANWYQVARKSDFFKMQNFFIMLTGIEIQITSFIFYIYLQ